MSSIISRGATASVQGRAEGPLRAKCEVLAYRRIGVYHSLTFVAPEIADRTSPGQFISLGVGAGGTLLRRPFSVYSVSKHGPWAGTVEVIFDVVGRGTEWLAERSKHDVVDVVGPLGRPFPMPQQQVSCLLVAWEQAAAPMLYLAQRLQAHGHRVDMLLGAATQGRVFNAIEAKRASAMTRFVTEDGSLGDHGRVPDLMGETLDAQRSGVVYGSGPMSMLRGVSEVATQRKLPCQVAVEEAMACGTGVCWTCVLPYRRKGEVVNTRACVDGPVFNGARIDWDATMADGAHRDEELTP